MSERSVRSGFRRRATRAFVALAAVAAIVAATLAGCGEDNYVVGGACATGFAQCGQACVDELTDPQNCGACGVVCASGTCSAGVCGGPTDATSDQTGDARTDANDAGDAGDGDAADGDAEPYDGPIEDGMGRDGGDAGDAADAADGADADGAVCTPPFNTPQHCGDCFTQCVAPNDQCKPSDGGFACAPFCSPPLTNCSGTCLDLTSDPFNCGMCGKICPSFLCQASQCVTGFNGELVLIGHDFSTQVPNPGSQVTVLLNSVFIRPNNPLRVLAYERYAAAAATARVTSILQNGPRPVTLTRTSLDGDIPTKLNVTDFDVLLVYDQAAAPAGALGALGTSWSSTLTTYLQAGGLVVVLDGAGAVDGGTSEMPALLTNGSLIAVTAQTVLPQGTRVKNIAPGDSVGRNVGAVYGTTLSSARFATEAASANVTYVIFDQPDNQPVVVHKTF